MKVIENVRHTFTTTVELDLNLLVHILVEVQDVFLLGLLLCTATTATFLAAATTTTTPTTTAERASFRHCSELFLTSK